MNDRIDKNIREAQLAGIYPSLVKACGRRWLDAGLAEWIRYHCSTTQYSPLGEVHTTSAQLAEYLFVSKGQIDRALKRLDSLGLIERRATLRGTRKFTIIKWSDKIPISILPGNSDFNTSSITPNPIPTPTTAGEDLGQASQPDRIVDHDTKTKRDRFGNYPTDSPSPKHEPAPAEPLQNSAKGSRRWSWSNPTETNQPLCDVITEITGQIPNGARGLPLLHTHTDDEIDAALTGLAAWCNASNVRLPAHRSFEMKLAEVRNATEGKVRAKELAEERRGRDKLKQRARRKAEDDEVRREIAKFNAGLEQDKITISARNAAKTVEDADPGEGEG